MNEPATFQEPASQPNPVAAPVSPLRMPTITSFGLGILLFFLPFLNIKCNNMVLQKVTGVQLATGFSVKGPGSDNSLFGSLESSFGSGRKIQSTKRQSANMPALAALLLGVAGFVFAIRNNKIASLLCGSIAVLALIATMIDIKSKLKTELGTTNPSGGFGYGRDAIVGVDFGPGFYLAILAFIAAAFFSYRWMNTKPQPPSS